METTALKTWELDNKVELVDPKRDALYNYDDNAHKQVAARRPWADDPNYFKYVRISAVALIKMTMHARSGGALEVMGLMQGYVEAETFIVTDAFRLPVEGTETRVNAQNEANEYLVEYLDLCRAQGRKENVVGWYHSHPGYGCWLSGIDVETQALQQKYQEPFLAVVVDPDRTISAGKVEIGAFRTYPSDHRPAKSSSGSHSASGDGLQAVPLAKAAEFGAHANRYYSLEVAHFKSSLDTRLLELLWHKYWVQTLSQSPLLTNRDFGNKQMLDLSSKLKEATAAVGRTRGAQSGMMAAGGGGAGGSGGGGGGRGMGMGGAGLTADKAHEKLAQESNLIAAKEMSGFMAAQIKANVFNDLGQKS